jgi:hypothetical protein
MVMVFFLRNEKTRSEAGAELLLGCTNRPMGRDAADRWTGGGGPVLAQNG